MLVVKRSGKTADLNTEEVKKRLVELSTGLSVDLEGLYSKIFSSIKDGMKTSEIDLVCARNSISMASHNNDYSDLASRIVISNHQRLTPKTFSQSIAILSNPTNFSKGRAVIASHVTKFVEEYAPQLDEMIRQDNDFLLDNMGHLMLEKSYLLKANGVCIERYQYLLMRVAVGLHLSPDLDYSKEANSRAAAKDFPSPNKPASPSSTTPKELQKAFRTPTLKDSPFFKYRAYPEFSHLVESVLNSIRQTYDLMSAQDYTHSSPTLFFSGTWKPQLASCFLMTLTEDSMDGIYETIKKAALITKFAGGIGISLSKVRARGSYIAGTNGKANGLAPLLNVLNATFRFVEQGGRRKGNCAVYLEPWHADVLEFIMLRRNTGNEETRCRDLFLALWIPDLFMKKLEKDEKWHLFSPDTAPGLDEVYGKEFEQLYEKYVAQGVHRKEIPARSLMREIVRSQVETGLPYVLYKDRCNEFSNQKNIGIIKNSNLCAEILEVANEKEIACCNLASLSLRNFVLGPEGSPHNPKLGWDEGAKKTNRYFLDLLLKGEQPESYLSFLDLPRLHHVAKVATRNLDNAISASFYPVEETERSNSRNRPLALGLQGLADTFLVLKLPFTSLQAREINRVFMETIYHGAVEASIELAEERGVYESFAGSPFSQGHFHYKNYEGTPLFYKDWGELEERARRVGMRNSLLTSLMPTAATAHVLRNSECFEPIPSNLYVKRHSVGDFTELNGFFIQDCLELGLWNGELRNQLVSAEGSVQALEKVPGKLRDVYRTVWEIPQKELLKMAAERQPFVDQTQSLNVYVAEPNLKKMVSMHMFGWKSGLKTGTYYLRTKAATEALKVTVKKRKEEGSGRQGGDEEEGCLSCSA